MLPQVQALEAQALEVQALEAQALATGDYNDAQAQILVKGMKAGTCQ